MLTLAPFALPGDRGRGAAVAVLFAWALFGAPLGASAASGQGLEEGVGRLIPTGDAAASVTAAPVSLADLPIVALLDFETSTLAPEHVDVLSQALWQALLDRGVVRILPRRQTRVWLIERDLYPFMPYQQAVPLDRVGRALNADYVVSGRLDRLGESYALTLAVFDVGKASPHDLHPQPALIAPDRLMADLAEAAGRIDELIRGRGRGTSLAMKIVLAASESGADASSTSSIKAADPAAKRRVQAESPLEPQGLPAARPTSVTQPVLIKPALREANGITSTTPTASGTISPTATATPGAAGATGPTLRVTATAAPARPGPAPAPAATAALVRSTATPAAARADALYREAIAMEPRSAERLAKVEQAAGLAPTAVLYVRQLASEYYQRGRYEDCSAQCDRALALEGQEGQAGSMLLTLKATALYELGRLEASREANEAALRADPTNHWARHNLAVTLTAQNSPRAAQAWRDYIERAKDDPEQRLLLDEARRKLADLERAGR